MQDLSREPGYARIKKRIQAFLNSDEQLLVVLADVAGWHVALVWQIAREYQPEAILAATGKSGATFQKLLGREVKTVHRALYSPTGANEDACGSGTPGAPAKTSFTLLVDLHGLHADDLRDLQQSSNKLIVIVTSDQKEVLDGNARRPFSGRGADITLRPVTDSSFEDIATGPDIIEVATLSNTDEPRFEWKPEPARLATACVARPIKPDWYGIYLADSGTLVAIISRKNAFRDCLHAGDVFVPAGTELPDILRDRFILVVSPDITPGDLARYDGRRFVCVPREAAQRSLGTDVVRPGTGSR